MERMPEYADMLRRVFLLGLQTTAFLGFFAENSEARGLGFLHRETKVRSPLPEKQLCIRTCRSQAREGQTVVFMKV